MTHRPASALALTLLLLVALTACTNDNENQAAATSSTGGSADTAPRPTAVPSTTTTSTSTTTTTTAAVDEWATIAQQALDADWQLVAAPGRTPIEAVYTPTSPQLEARRQTVEYLTANGLHSEGAPNTVVSAVLADELATLAVLRLQIDRPASVRIVDASGVEFQAIRFSEAERRSTAILTLQRGPTSDEWYIHELVLVASPGG